MCSGGYVQGVSKKVISHFEGLFGVGVGDTQYLTWLRPWMKAFSSLSLSSSTLQSICQAREHAM